MKNGYFWELGHISDDQLRRGLTGLLASGYRTEARIVAHIAEIEERKLHLKDGAESLFSYCLTSLELSHSEAFHRITASPQRASRAASPSSSACSNSAPCTSPPCACSAT